MPISTTISAFRAAQKVKPYSPHQHLAAERNRRPARVPDTITRMVAIAATIVANEDDNVLPAQPPQVHPATIEHDPFEMQRASRMASEKAFNDYIEKEKMRDLNALESTIVARHNQTIAEMRALNVNNRITGLPENMPVMECDHLTKNDYSRYMSLRGRAKADKNTLFNIPLRTKILFSKLHDEDTPIAVNTP